jgi:hypothetical protein
VIVDEEDVSMISSDIGPLKLSPDVLVCEQQVASLIPWDTEMEWPEPRASERGPFRNRSAQSTIARLLANRWSATLDEVLASSTLWNNQNYNHAPVGTVEGITIERAVNTLRNPHRKKTTVGDLLPRKL